MKGKKREEKRANLLLKRSQKEGYSATQSERKTYDDLVCHCCSAHVLARLFTATAVTVTAIASTTGIELHALEMTQRRQQARGWLKIGEVSRCGPATMLEHFEQHERLQHAQLQQMVQLGSRQARAAAG